MKNISHKKLEKNTNDSEKVLEIGAGNGHHFKFVTHNFKEYHMVDPQLYLGSDISDPRIIQHKKDFLDCTFLEGNFDRIIMTCVLHHIENPYKFLTKVRATLKPGGLFSFYMPTDPSIITFLNRRFLVEPTAKRLGVLNYDLINAIEHKNSVYSLNRILRDVFIDCKIRTSFFPLPFLPFICINGYIIFSIRSPKYD